MKKSKLLKHLVAPILIFALMFSFSLPALAVEDSGVETALSNIKGTISKLNLNIAQGKVSKTNLQTLASQLYDLEKAVKATGEVPSAQVIAVLNDAETVGTKAKSADVLTAVSVVRESLGIKTAETSTTLENKKANLTFDDVKQGQWFYDAIMDMVSKGILNGTTTPDANGVGHFDADGAMTKSAYIMVAVRVAYLDELNAMPAGETWWSNAYDIALKHGIIKNNDPGMRKMNDDMNKSITRQEMAMILVRTAHAKGMSESNWVYGAQIPDYVLIDGYYKDYVRECYTMGLLNGTDSKGTFSPLGVLNRASACQSFYNLLHPEKLTKRTPQMPGGGSGSSTQTPTAQVQTFKEGEKHSIPKVGDTVIRASDGKAIVIEKGIGGVLGAGQGVDIWTGVNPEGNKTSNLVENGSILFEYSLRPFEKDSITGEMHTIDEWQVIQEATDPDGKVVGDYVGEVYNTWWEWVNILGGTWSWIGPSC